MSIQNSARTNANNFRRILRSMIVILRNIWLEAFVYKPSQNINPYTRWSLFLTGCLFLGIAMSVDAPLHWLVLLPLTAIYMIQAAIIGYEPLYSVNQRIGNSNRKKTFTPMLKISH